MRTKIFFSRERLIRLIETTVEWLYHLLLCVTPLLFTWFNDELFEFNKMLFVYGIAGSVGLLFLVRQIVREKWEWKRTLFDIPLLIFVLSQCVSTIFSLHPRTSFFGYYNRLHGGLLSTFAYVLLFGVGIQLLERKKIERLFTSLMIGSFIVTAIAIPEHFGRSFTCTIIHSAQLLESQPLTVVLSPEQLWLSYDTSCWVQDVKARVFSTFGQPNWLAAYAVMLIPLFSALSVLQKGRSRWTFFAASLALFLTLLFTKSRSGFLAWLSGNIAFFTLGSLWTLTRARTTQYTLHIALIVCCQIALLGLFGSPYSPSLIQMVSNHTTQEVKVPQSTTTPVEPPGTDSGIIRTIVWRGALDVWKRYPLIGSGVETFAYTYSVDRIAAHNETSEWDFLYNKAHNEFLQFFTTTGVFGLLAYCSFLLFWIGGPIYFIQQYIRTPAAKKEGSSLEVGTYRVLIALALSCGIIALSVTNFFGFSTVMVSVLLFLFPVFAWHLCGEPPKTQRALTKTEKKSDTLAESFSPTLRQSLWLCVVALLAFLLYVMIWRAWRADFLLAQGKNNLQAGEYSLALDQLELARELSNGEGVFIEELAKIYGWLSVGMHDVEQSEEAEVFRLLAKEAVIDMLAENPHHMIVYKTAGEILLALAPQEPELLQAALPIIEKQRELAPTDPRSYYALGLVHMARGEREKARQALEYAISLRPAFLEPQKVLTTLDSPTASEKKEEKP